MPDIRSRTKKGGKGRSRYIASGEEIEKRNASRHARYQERVEGEEDSEESGDEIVQKTQTVNDNQNYQSEEEEEEENSLSPQDLGFQRYNPNHDPNAVSTSSRKREQELAKLKHDKKMEKLRLEGKTDQAKADLARLAEIRARREIAANEKNKGTSPN